MRIITMTLNTRLIIINYYDNKVCRRILTLLLGASNLLDGGQCWVEFQGTEDVSNVESINALVGAVVDLPDEVYA